MAAGHDTIVVRAATDGPQTITPQGFLHLPAAIRHRCRIHTGDRLLVAAYPDQDLILVCTSPCWMNSSPPASAPRHERPLTDHCDARRPGTPRAAAAAGPARRQP
jgi:hypothetical protein